MPVIPDAILEGLAINGIELCRVQAARFTIATDAVSLDIA